MPKIKFENGTTVNFDSMPSMQDITEVARKLGIKQQTQQPGYLSRVAQDYAQAGQNITNEWQKQMAMNPQNTGPMQALGQSAETALRTAGQTAGAAFAPIMEAPGVKQATQWVGEQIPKTSIGQSLGKLAAAHPEAAQNIGDVLNLAGLGIGEAVEAPVAGAAENIAGKTAEAVTGIPAKLAEKSSAALDKNILEAITPELSKTRAGELIAKGGAKVEKGTIFDTVSQKVTQRMANVKDAIKPFYDKSATLTENVNNVRTALGNEAEQLKSDIAANDHPYTFKELNSKLKNVELPISFKNDAVQSRTLRDIVNAAMNISKEKGGTVSSLLDARKEFDNLVDENFPNLYEKGKPTNTYYAITRVRNAMNDFIEENLPDDVKYKDSLKKQSLYYDAIDSLSAKAGEELGTKSNVLTRKAANIVKKYPGIATGVGLTVGYEGAKKLGIPLP